MRLHDRKIFLNKQKLWEMLNLRMNGYAISTLAIIYHCDMKAIRYQCDKYKITPPDNELYAVERIVSKTISKSIGNWKFINGERINIGKSYKEYLEEAKRKYSPKNQI